MKLLKYFAVLSFMLVGFPLVFTFDCAGFGGFSVLRIALYYAIGAAVVAVGFAAVGGCEQCRGKKVLYGLAKAGVGVIGGMLLALCFIFGSVANIDYMLRFCLVLFYLLCYFIGCYSYGKSFADVFPIGWLGGYVIETIILYFAFGAFVPEQLIKTGQTVMLVMFIVECAFAAVLINQTNILVQASRRSETRGMLPKNMRAYNLLLISGVSSLLLLAYVFRDFIASVLFNICKALVDLVLFLMTILPTSEIPPEEEEDVIGAAEGTLQQVDDTSMIIMVALILLVIFLLRKQIIKEIRQLVRRIGAFFSEKKKDGTEYSEAYFDEYEELDRADTRERKPETLKSCLREYSRERNGEKKFRLGYKAYLLWLRDYRIQPLPSDTAARHEKKGEQLSNNQGLCKKIERYYNELRYDGVTSAEAGAAMDELIEIIAGK